MVSKVAVGDQSELACAFELNSIKLILAGFAGVCQHVRRESLDNFLAKAAKELVSIPVKLSIGSPSRFADTAACTWMGHGSGLLSLIVPLSRPKDSAFLGTESNRPILQFEKETPPVQRLCTVRAFHNDTHLPSVLKMNIPSPLKKNGGEVLEARGFLMDCEGCDVAF